MRGRWLGIVIAAGLIGAEAYAQERQPLTRPPGILVSAWVGPTSSLRDRVADSVGQALKQRVDPKTMSVTTRVEALRHAGIAQWPRSLGRADLLEFGKSIDAGYIVDIDIDDERSGAQLTTLVIERATNAERRLERIPFDDLAKAVRILVERIATDSIMSRLRHGCAHYHETQIHVGGC